MNEPPRRVELPEDLELMAPGPELCALLASAPRTALSDKDRVRLLRARNRLAAHVQGELYADLYAVSLEDDADEAAMVRHDAPSRYPWATSEVAFALTWTETAAGARLEQARQLAEDLPQVFAALRDGRIDMPKVLVICELAGWLDDRDAAARLVDALIDRAPDLTTGQLRAKLRQLVLAVDPQAARRRCARALKTRRVESFPNPDGTGELWGRSLPPQDAAAAWERLTAIARAAKAAGDNRTMDQLRADALLDLLVGEGIAVGQPLGRHLAGLPEADGPPFTDLDDPADQPTPSPDTAATLDSPRGQGNAGSGVTEWDPAWPAEPPDRHLRADQVWPRPVGPPVDRVDSSGEAYDGVHEWPPDWPGRWMADPAVVAAGAAAGSTHAGRSGAGDGHRPGSAAPVFADGSPGGALPAPRRGTVELLLPLSTAIGADDLPGELAGWGPVIADIARHIAAEQHRAQWRYSAYNRLGELEHHGITTARPSASPTARPSARGGASRAALADAQTAPRQRRTGRRPAAHVAAYVTARNRTCTAPGCRIPARACDLDHTIDWSRGGESTETNLGPGCRRHHMFKHESGATVWQLDPGGVFVWTTRRGMQHLTKPDPPLLTRGQLFSRLPDPPDTS